MFDSAVIVLSMIKNEEPILFVDCSDIYDGIMFLSHCHWKHHNASLKSI